jgi:hypothetical protein
MAGKDFDAFISVPLMTLHSYCALTKGINSTSGECKEPATTPTAVPAIAPNMPEPHQLMALGER